MYNKRKVVYTSNDVVTFTKPTSTLADSYRRIKVNIDSKNSNNAKVFMVTSAIDGEGKTLSLINLASCYSEDKTKKVLVIDLNLRNPNLHNYFGVNNENGVVDFVEDDSKLNIISNKEMNLDLLVSGKSTSYPTIALESKKLKDLILSLRDKYDYIFVDTPSVRSCPDALVVATCCDATLFVISKIVSNKKDTLLSIKELKNNNIEVMGTIYNDIK